MERKFEKIRENSYRLIIETLIIISSFELLLSYNVKEWTKNIPLFAQSTGRLLCLQKIVSLKKDID